MPKFFESWQKWKTYFVKTKPVEQIKPILPWPFRKIVIRIVPQSWMRPQYRDGYGDYWVDEKGTLQIAIRQYDNPDFAFGCAIHELIEAWRCYKKGITLESIERWDDDHADVDDPGRMPDAPYHFEHMQSMDIERLMCLQDGYSYDVYDDAKPIEGG